jgi:hypothetical protein
MVKLQTAVNNSEETFGIQNTAKVWNQEYQISFEGPDVTKYDKT